MTTLEQARAEAEAVMAELMCEWGAKILSASQVEGR